ATCPSCQFTLEQLAAETDWWTEARDRLSKSSLVVAAQETDGERSKGSVKSSRQSNHGPSDVASHDRDLLHDAGDESYASDFAVDFLEPSNDPASLGKLGDYEIIEVVGRGGMGIVLKGYQKELNRFVAVKVLAPHLATSGAARRRFAREAQATAAVVH